MSGSPPAPRAPPAGRWHSTSSRPTSPDSAWTEPPLRTGVVSNGAMTVGGARSPVGQRMGSRPDRLRSMTPDENRSRVLGLFDEVVNAHDATAIQGYTTNPAIAGTLNHLLDAFSDLHFD